jgi:hypothetical protein
MCVADGLHECIRISVIMSRKLLCWNGMQTIGVEMYVNGCILCKTCTYDIFPLAFLITTLFKIGLFHTCFWIEFV